VSILGYLYYQVNHKKKKA